MKKATQLRLISPMGVRNKIIFIREIPNNRKLIQFLSKLTKITHAIYGFKIVDECKADIHIPHIEVYIRPHFNVERFLNINVDESSISISGLYQCLTPHTTTKVEFESMIKNVEEGRRFFEALF